MMKINFYKSLLPYLPWLTFILGVFHLIGELGRQSGYGQLWNVGLFIALLSQQYCQRKGAFKLHFLLSNYNLNSDYINYIWIFSRIFIMGSKFPVSLSRYPSEI